MHLRCYEGIMYGMGLEDQKSNVHCAQRADHLRRKRDLLTGEKLTTSCLSPVGGAREARKRPVMCRVLPAHDDPKRRCG